MCGRLRRDGETSSEAWRILLEHLHFPVRPGSDLPQAAHVTTHDDDILDFEFIDDATTREMPVRDVGEPVARPAPEDDGSPPRRPRFQRPERPGGWTPLLRLVGLIAFAILVVVLVVVWAQGCASDRERDAYTTYNTAIEAVGDDSAGIGDDLSTLLTTPGLKQDELEQQLAGLIQQQQLGVKRAQELDVPGPMRSANDRAVAALEFRVVGMRGLLDVFRKTKDAKDATVAGTQLAAQGQRLLASDVVWSDLFRIPAQAQLAAADVNGVTAPASVFADPADLYTARSMTAIWQRVHGASTGGTPTGLHGTGLASVTVQPSGQQLSTAQETTVQASTDLAFDVAVTNTGDSQEVQVEVTLTIPKQPTSIVKKATIELIDPGETETVTFRDFPDPPFGEKTTVKVDVKPVPGEKNTTNNTAEYPVVFSLG
jgi:hypothetical protein